MGLAQPGVAVDEQRVVRPGRRLGHRQRGGVGEPVRRAGDEGLEGVAGVEGPDLGRVAVAGPVGEGRLSEDREVRGGRGCLDRGRTQRCRGLVAPGGRRPVGIADLEHDVEVGTTHLGRARSARAGDSGSRCGRCTTVLGTETTRRPPAQASGRTGRNDVCQTASDTWTLSRSLHESHTCRASSTPTHLLGLASPVPDGVHNSVHTLWTTEVTTGRSGSSVPGGRATAETPSERTSPSGPDVRRHRSTEKPTCGQRTRGAKSQVRARKQRDCSRRCSRTASSGTPPGCRVPLRASTVADRSSLLGVPARSLPPCARGRSGRFPQATERVLVHNPRRPGPGGFVEEASP